MSREVGNPQGLCTWDESAECETCPNHNLLYCKWDRRLLFAFFMLYLPFLVVGWFGMAIVWRITGAWWYMAVYGGFYILFFGFLEIRILCSHCPYYGGDSGFSLRCLANNGAMKLWKYHPEPMNSLERVGLLLGFVFLGGFPVFANFYGVYFVALNYSAYDLTLLLSMICIATLTAASALSFFFALYSYVCPKCVNFSCPLNRVPTEAVDEYLRKNPVMREAWEEAGYKLA